MDASGIHCIDLGFQGQASAIGSYLVETNAGAVLVETGPHSTLPALEAGLGAYGVSLSSVRHVLLTHIHLDHAGAAWALARAGARVYVHPEGAPHLIDPEKLIQSATRLYGDQMNKLWGRIEAIDPKQVIAVADKDVIVFGDTRFEAIHTPGHARHHIAWCCDNEHLFTGDVCGVQLSGGPIIAPCPPPDIDLDAWDASLKRIQACAPRYLYLTHYGSVPYQRLFLDEVRTSYQKAVACVAEHAQQPIEHVHRAFEAHIAARYKEAGLSDKDKGRYEAANPTNMSVMGLLRYLRKKNKG